MKTQKQKTQELYNMDGVPSNVETQIIQTSTGNFIYRHFLSGNSPQDSRVFNPQTGEDKFLDNQGYFHYLSAICKMPVDVQPGCLLASEVSESFRNRLTKLPTVGSMIAIY